MRIIALLAVWALLAASSAQARTVCAPYDNLAGFLAQTHHERVIARAVTANGYLMETFVSDEGTWTIVIVTPQGHACVLAAGHGWEAQERGDEGPGA